MNLLDDPLPVAGISHFSPTVICFVVSTPYSVVEQSEKCKVILEELSGLYCAEEPIDPSLKLLVMSKLVPAPSGLPFSYWPVIQQQSFGGGAEGIF